MIKKNRITSWPCFPGGSQGLLVIQHTKTACIITFTVGSLGSVVEVKKIVLKKENWPTSEYGSTESFAIGSYGSVCIDLRMARDITNAWPFRACKELANPTGSPGKVFPMLPSSVK